MRDDAGFIESGSCIKITTATMHLARRACLQLGEGQNSSCTCPLVLSMPVQVEDEKMKKLLRKPPEV